MFIKVTAFKDQVLYNAPNPDEEETTEGEESGDGPGGGNNEPGLK